MLETPVITFLQVASLDDPSKFSPTCEILSFVCSTMAPYTRYCVIREGPVGGRAGRPHRRVLCQTRSADRVNAAALGHKITWVEVHNSCGMRGQGNDISRVWGGLWVFATPCSFEALVGPINKVLRQESLKGFRSNTA